MKNIIFLDIDEVICTDRSRFAFRRIDGIDPVACYMLLSLCDETDSEIVVHSSWRHMEDGIFALREQLDVHCPRLNTFIIGCTDPNIWDKAESINDWLDKNINSEQVYDFAIIDNEVLNFQEFEDLADHFFLVTNPAVGISTYECMSIKRSLNGTLI